MKAAALSGVCSCIKAKQFDVRLSMLGCPPETALIADAPVPCSCSPVGLWAVRQPTTVVHAESFHTEIGDVGPGSSSKSTV